MSTDRILDILKQDTKRIKILDIVSKLKLPQCFVAAGFLRNMVWDYIHGYKNTELNDIDIVYFDKNEETSKNSLKIENKLKNEFPEFNWEVRNQAIMHKRNGNPQYSSTIDAMSYWPEKETAVGIRKLGQNDYEIISVFEINSLFSNTITHNPKRDIEVFKQRVKEKSWLSIWPLLKVIS